MTTTEEKIKVMQAFTDGEEVQYTYRGNTPCWKCAPDPCWDWERFNYRVKPRKIKMYAYLADARLEWYTSASMGYKRVPAEDKTIEVEV